MTSTAHEFYIREAIDMSRAALEKRKGPYAALLVRGDQVLLRAENTAAVEGALHHAEMNLLNEAQKLLELDEWRECTLYASTEPCAMCAGAMVWAGIGRVVFGCPVPRQVEILGGGLRIRCADIFAAADGPPELVGPVLAEEAASVLKVAAKNQENAD